MLAVFAEFSRMGIDDEGNVEIQRMGRTEVTLSTMKEKIALKQVL